MATKINLNGIELTLKQDAYLDNHGDTSAYFALAVDNDGNEYRVRWTNIAAGHVNNADGNCKICGESCEYSDDSNCADWDHPVDAVKL